MLRSQTSTHSLRTGTSSRARAGLVYAPLIASIGAIARPTLGVAAFGFLVEQRVLMPVEGALLLLACVALRTQMLHWLARSNHRPFPRVTRMLRATSREDWSRRMRTQPAREGWRSAIVRSRDADSVVGVALSQSPITPFVLFHGARFLAQAMWASLALAITILVLRVAVRPLLWAVIAPRFDTPTPVLLALLALIAPLVAYSASRVPSLLTEQGRRHARIVIDRASHHEYWPAWLFYAPLLPFVVLQGLRTRGLLTPSACNPAIPNAGGWIGESKSAIMRAIGGSPFALTTILITPEHDPAERAARVRTLMREHALDFPVILKPDAGQRGFALKLARTDSDLDPYFHAVRSPVVVQPYHPGPCECGVMWVRWTARERARGAQGAGRIFSITRKEFPVLVGDGLATLEGLIERHPRFRRQHRVFLERFRHEASRVPEKSERIRLSVSGNHCQGTLFLDGGDLITPELTRVIDDLCARYGESTGQAGGLDAARLDIRYESDELLRAGRSFAIVELNGTSAESTNMYDPSWRLRRAYSTLFAHWRLLYELGAERIDAGGRGATLRELIAMTRAHYATRTGDAISD